MILTLTGASGCGKSTLAKALIKLLPNAELSPGCTTRSLRMGETAADVYQMSQKEFNQKNENGEFLWAVEIHGHWYGTLKRIVEEGLSAPEHCLILVLTSDVLPNLKKFAFECGSSNLTRSIYITSPEQSELRSRLQSRKVSSEEIECRLADCITWDQIAYSSNLYDLFIPGEGDIELNARKVIDSLSLARLS